MENIVLIGFMGTGKTVIGRALAKNLEYDFIDTDNAIEEVTGFQLKAFFKKYGQIRFSSEESLIIKKVATQSNLIIATGGTTNLNPDLNLLREQSFFVWLDAPAATLYERLMRKNNRYFMGKKPDLPGLENILQQRNLEYEQLANLKINTAAFSVPEICEQIKSAYEQYVQIA